MTNSDRPQSEDARTGTGACGRTTGAAWPMPPSPASPREGVASADLLQVYTKYQETMQAFLRLQEQVLHQVAGNVPHSSTAGGAVSVPASVAVATESFVPAVDEEVPQPVEEGGVGVEALVIQLVAERTGYPPDMLGQDLDLEADLGIDSIKRLEILSALLKTVPAGHQAEASMDQLTRARTLREVIAELEKVLSGTDTLELPGAPADAVEIAALDHATAVKPVGRFMTRPVAKPLTGRASMPVGNYVIVADPAPLLEKLVQGLELNGCTATMVPASVDAEHVPEIVAAVRAKEPFAGMIFLAGHEAIGLPESAEEWRATQHSHVFGLFHYLKVLGQDLAERGGGVVAISRMGGAYGRNGDVGVSSPLAGAAVGLLKTFALETPGVWVRTIDFGSQSEAHVSRLIMAELAAPDAGVEIGYDKQCQRFEYVLDVADRPAAKAFPPAFHPESNGVLLAIGGARGITAEAIIPLVVKGMRVILVGRHPLVVEAEQPALRDAKDEAAIRGALVAMRKQDGQTATPAMMEEELRAILRNRSIQATLERLVLLGAEPEYHAIDMTDEQAVGEFLNQVYQKWERINVVVHGAGIIEDKLLADKTESSFRRVFSAKADSTFLLRRHLRPEHLKAVVLFGSVAGRTGNRGQCDYAAANETMNRQAFEMAQAWPETRIVCFNWGPWASTGMVSEAVRRQFEARGVVPIPAEAGAAFVLEELQGSARDIEVVAGIFQPPQDT